MSEVEWNAECKREGGKIQRPYTEVTEDDAEVTERGSKKWGVRNGECEGAKIQVRVWGVGGGGRVENKKLRARPPVSGWGQGARRGAAAGAADEAEVVPSKKMGTVWLMDR